MAGHSPIRHFAVLLTLTLVGCKTSDSPSSNGDAVEIKIGHYASMTGSEATFGQSTDNGIKLAIEEINAAGGINGKQVRADHLRRQGRRQGSRHGRHAADDQRQGDRGARRSRVEPVARRGPVCQENGVPMITPSSTNPRVTKVGDMIFRVCFIDPFQGSSCAQVRRGEPEGQEGRRSCTTRPHAYSIGLAEEFEKAFKKLGGTITTSRPTAPATRTSTPSSPPSAATSPT